MESIITLFVGNKKIYPNYPIYTSDEAKKTAEKINKYFTLKKRYQKKNLEKVVIYCLPTFTETIESIR